MPTITLYPDLGIEQADALKALLIPRLHTAEDVVIDAEAVERVHSATLQVLCAFKRNRDAVGIGTRIEPASTPLRDAASMLGLATALGIER